MRALKDMSGMPCAAATLPIRLLSSAHTLSAVGVTRMPGVCMASKGFRNDPSSNTDASVKVPCIKGIKPQLPHGNTCRRDCPYVPHHHAPIRFMTGGRFLLVRDQSLPSRKLKEQTPMQNSEAPVGEPSSPAAESTPRPASTSASPPRSTNEPEKVVASTPQALVDRMFPRMVTCALIAVVFGLMLLVFFYFHKESLGDDFPMWIVYVSQNLTFGGGLLGITFGIFSTSWDPNREGSVLGWDEFRVNFSVVPNKGK